MPVGPIHGRRPKRALSIRTHLIAFALALVLPMLGLVSFLVWRYADAEQTRVLDEALLTARQTTVAIDRELTGMVATLQALATSPSLQAADLESFHQQARKALTVADAQIAVQDLHGRQLANSHLPWGSDLTVGVGQGLGVDPIDTKHPYISDVHANTGSSRWGVSVTVPVLRREETVYVLTMTVPAEHWLAVVRQGVATGWSARLVDRKGVVIADTHMHQHVVGRTIPGTVKPLLKHSGTVESESEGQPVLVAQDRSEMSGWAVRIAVPVEVIHAPSRRILVLMAGASGILLCLSLTLALAFGRRIAQPIAALSATAAKMGRGEPVHPLKTGLTEVNEVGTSLAAASIGLRERSAALRLSEERYRLATEAFQGAVFDYDAAKNLSDRTPRYFEIIGEKPGAVPTTKEGWHERIHPEDWPIFEEARRSMYENGAPQYEAEYRVRHQDGGWVWVWHRALAMRDERGGVRRVVGAILDITQRKKAEEHLKLVVNELNHRVKNTLATVQSIAMHTLRASATPEQAYEALQARLMALSAAHNVLTQQNWGHAKLDSIVAEVLEPYRVVHADKFRFQGPDIAITPGAAVALSMALHELATNAAKYGALSNQAGQVDVSWQVLGDRHTGRVRLKWNERGGPPVEKPRRKGFGSRLIERSVAHELGEARIDYRPSGVVCVFEWRLAEVDRRGDQEAARASVLEVAS